MMTSGVFAISRSLWADPDFADSEFSEREAFIWLVSEAAWKDHKARGVYGPIELKRGEVCHSLRFMGEAWGWKKDRVARFIKRLQKRGVIRDTSRDSEKVYFLIKYNKFQTVGLPERDTTRETTATPARHRRDKLETGETLKQDNNGDFEKFWDAYGYKRGRGQALRAWNGAIKKTTPSILIAKAAEYRKSFGSDQTYQRHASTWLNGECWEDEISSTPTADTYQSPRIPTRKGWVPDKPPSPRKANGLQPIGGLKI